MSSVIRQRKQSARSGKDAAADIIDCQRIVLRDAAGRIRLELGVSPSGSAEIILRAPGGQIRARVHVDDNGAAGVETMTASGSCSASLVSQDGDNPGAAAIVRSPGKRLVALTASERNGPSCDIVGEHDDVEDLEGEEVGMIAGSPFGIEFTDFYHLSPDWKGGAQ